MDEFARYALYYAPPPGALADFAAGWLGWDAAGGRAVAQSHVPGLDLAAITATPRKYGFHGTLKPPFRLARGQSAAALHEACGALASGLRPVAMAGLQLKRLAGFLALVPEADTADLAGLAATVVRDLDRFRAPPDATEIARRRPERLSPRQRDLLDRWGYPHVMEEFRFHLTLTGDLGDAGAHRAETALAPLLAPVLPRPFLISDICLFGEARDGMFRILHRYALSG